MKRGGGSGEGWVDGKVVAAQNTASSTTLTTERQYGGELVVGKGGWMANLTKWLLQVKRLQVPHSPLTIKWPVYSGLDSKVVASGKSIPSATSTIDNKVGRW